MRTIIVAISLLAAGVVPAALLLGQQNDAELRFDVVNKTNQPIVLKFVHVRPEIEAVGTVGANSTVTWDGLSATGHRVLCGWDQRGNFLFSEPVIFKTDMGVQLSYNNGKWSFAKFQL